MNCYFCQSPLKEDSISHRRADGTSWKFYESCDNCVATCDVDKVFTTFADDSSVLYAHIYIAEPTATWHIRLHLKEDYTQIGEDEDGWNDVLFQIPSFPINPSNARDKVKLYVLFS